MKSLEHPLFIIALSFCALMLSTTSAGGATAHNSGGDDQYTFFDPPTEFPIPDTDPYNTVTSTVDDIDDPGHYLGSTASLKAGTNTTGAEVDVTMAWRNRTNIEIDGQAFDLSPDGRQYIRDGINEGDPGIAIAWDAYNMVSDVVDITGVVGTYVLEMDYDEATLRWHYTPNPWPGLPGETLEEGLDRLDRIYLGWFAIDTDYEGALADYDEWVNAVEGNSATGGSAVANYKGTYAAFASANSITEATLVNYLGSFGVDIASDTVWAVLDHNSAFGTVPEPATLTLLALGGLAVLRKRRRRSCRRS